MTRQLAVMIPHDGDETEWTLVYSYSLDGEVEFLGSKREVLDRVAKRYHVVEHAKIDDLTDRYGITERQWEDWSFEAAQACESEMDEGPDYDEVLT